MNTTNESRTSLYLVRRADALIGVLKFFTARSPRAKERQFQFLAQVDYWEWEIDNLIYSFTNLAERSRTWESPTATVQKLHQLGIAVDSKTIHRIRWDHGWKLQHERRRVAPINMLRQAIDTWNELIDVVDARFIQPMRSRAERFNMQVLKDLNHLRKQIPDLDNSDSE